jgi:hypothetical protein
MYGKLLDMQQPMTTEFFLYEVLFPACIQFCSCGLALTAKPSKPVFKPWSGLGLEPPIH